MFLALQKILVTNYFIVIKNKTQPNQPLLQLQHLQKSQPLKRLPIYFLLVFNINGLKVNYNGDTDTVTLSGVAKTQADRERARLAVGNVQHVETVVDNIEVESAEPESRFYTVKSGDSLSKIAKEMYGNANDYMKIFDANKPMLSDPNKIYPGQVLRIPQ